MWKVFLMGSLVWMTTSYCLLRNPFSDEKIKEVAICMGPLKAPKPDGLYQIFFQNNWDVVRPSVGDTMRCFSEPNLINDINGTSITLILKCDAPTCMNQFRQIIILCDVVYTIITKIIMNRLKELMSRLLGPN